MKGAGCGCALLPLFLLVTPLVFAAPGSHQPADDPPTGVVVQPTGSWCAPAVGCQQPVAELAYLPPHPYPDHFVNPPGQCTSWAAALWPGHHGHGVTWSGDAWEWFVNAAAAGYQTAKTPSLGAIVVFARGDTPATSFGHVAVVVTVGGKSLRITEMNLNTTFVVDERTVSRSDAGIVGYVPVPQDAFP